MLCHSDGGSTFSPHPKGSNNTKHRQRPIKFLAMNEKTKKTLKYILILVLVLAVAGAIAAGIYFAVQGRKTVNAIQSAQASNGATSAAGQYPHLGVPQVNMQGLHGCFAPPPAYSPTQDIVPADPAFVPPYQAALSNLPAMQQADFQQEFPGNGIGPSAREGIDSMSTVSLDSTNFGPEDDYDARVRATKGVGVSAIYSRGDNKGISLINQKSRMLDPTKMLPNVDPARQSERMVQAGPSIEAISCRTPKAADIMRLLRASRGNALSHTIPKDKPPIYTQGLNAFRPTPLPASTFGGGGCTIGISPYEVSDLIDYAPNPFLQSSRAAGAGFNYTV